MLSTNILPVSRLSSCSCIGTAVVGSSLENNLDIVVLKVVATILQIDVWLEIQCMSFVQVNYTLLNNKTYSASAQFISFNKHSDLKSK